MTSKRNSPAKKRRKAMRKRHAARAATIAARRAIVPAPVQTVSRWRRFFRRFKLAGA